ncbi:MAG: transglycosylase domain-containing protein [Deltaproteobacteria bacterium]|nr:transglycosylase domain-containing protein [Deltaproteobacteria bacterium]
MFRRIFWNRWGLLALCLVVGGTAALAWGVSRIESHLRATLERRLEGSGFALRWQSLDAHLDGTLRIRQVELREGAAPMARIETVHARLSWWSLWTGGKRLSWLRVERPELHVDLYQGRPVAWQRLGAAWRKTAEPGEATEKRSLADRVGEVALRDGTVHIRVLGDQVWLTGPEHRVTGLQLTLDSGTGGQGQAQMPALLGGGLARFDVQLHQGKPTVVHAGFEPAARYVPPALAHGTLPAELSLRWQGLRWESGAGFRVESPHVADLAADATAPALLRAASLALDGTATATLHDIEWTIGKPRWFGALADWAAAHPAQLPAEWTRTAAIGDLHGQVLSLHVARSAEGWTVDLRKAVAGGRDLRVGLDGARANIGRTGSDGARGPVQLALRGPFAEVSRRAPWFDRAAPWVERALAIRQVPDPPPDEDETAEDDAPGEGAPTGTAPPAAAAAVRKRPTAPQPTTARERPPQRMARQIKQLHGSVLALPGKAARLWPWKAWPNWLAVEVQDGRAAVLGEDGQPLIGVRGAGFRADGRTLARQGWWAGLEPFDRKGSWGRAGMQWRRGGEHHHLDVHLQGGGVAQVVGAHVGGLSVGDGAELDVQLAIDLLPEPSVRIAGRAAVDKMGLHWWRLADRPIADFASTFTFEMVADKERWSLRSPEAQIGAATLRGSLALQLLAGNPRLSVKVDAPMQDCGRMLAAIPPSLLPTVGAIEAKGVLDWHVGLDVAFPNVGAVAVDLALGDTWCTVDKLGGIDFGEFKRADWVRPVNENGRILNDVLIGPGSGSWTSTMHMPGYVHYVMWATEDPFLKHRGISEDLLAKAIAIDLATGRFTYGGSTITQQLVKNLYLRRTKALSRKFEEMIIVWQMEKALGKARILEIYVNAVEFGPRVYGITRAAWEFFQKRPAELRPKEAVYLAIIKPSPRSGWGTMRANGWGEWYEVKTGKYMDKLLRDESITPAQYEADKPWKPAFNPAPRGVRPPGR